MKFDIFKYQDILKKATIGFEFEFFSNTGIEDTRDKVEKLLGKKIRIETKSHSEFIPTKDEFKMEPDFSGGEKLIELVTGPLPYQEARLLCINFLKWLETNGYTSEKSAIHVNVGFDKSMPNFLSKLDTLKYILDFDEDYIFKMWPNRKNSIYARTIKLIVPTDKFYTEKITAPIDPRNYIVPNEKYYGINFSKLIKNYLEFRYLGGDGYEKKIQNILDMTDYFVLSLYNSVMNPSYTEKNLIELQEILDKHKDVIDSYKSYEDFKKTFPDIKLTVDLSDNEKIMKTFYGNLRDKIFTLLSKSNFRKGKLNFDTTLSTYQIKDAEFQAWFIDFFEFVDCKISGSLIHRSDFYNCELTSCEVHESNMFLNSKGTKCKFKDSYFNKSGEAKNCYIFGKNSVFNGTMIDGIFREGKLSNVSRISKGTEVVEYEEIKVGNKNKK